LIGAIVPPFLKPVGSALCVRFETVLQFWPNTTGECIDLPLCLCELGGGMRNGYETTPQSVQGRGKRQHRKPGKRRLGRKGGGACGGSWGSRFPVSRAARGRMHGHGGDSGGVRAYVESGGGDGRRKRRMTKMMTTETGWHDKI